MTGRIRIIIKSIFGKFGWTLLDCHNLFVYGSTISDLLADLGVEFILGCRRKWNLIIYVDFHCCFLVWFHNIIPAKDFNVIFISTDSCNIFIFEFIFFQAFNYWPDLGCSFSRFLEKICERNLVLYDLALLSFVFFFFFSNIEHCSCLSGICIEMVQKVEGNAVFFSSSEWERANRITPLMSDLFFFLKRSQNINNRVSIF